MDTAGGLKPDLSTSFCTQVSSSTVRQAVYLAQMLRRFKMHRFYLPSFIAKEKSVKTVTV